MIIIICLYTCDININTQKNLQNEFVFIFRLMHFMPPNVGLVAIARRQNAGKGDFLFIFTSCYKANELLFCKKNR